MDLRRSTGAGGGKAPQAFHFLAGYAANNAMLGYAANNPTQQSIDSTGGALSSRVSDSQNVETTFQARQAHWRLGWIKRFGDLRMFRNV